MPGFIEIRRNIYYQAEQKKHWRDIPVTSERPSPYHVPVVEDGEHMGWEVAEGGVERAYESTLARIKQAHSNKLADVRDRYSLEEKLGWHRLEKAVDKYHENGTVIKCLKRYADKLGVSHEEAVDRIETAIDNFDEAYGDATGELTRLRDEADALYEAGDIEGLEAMEQP